MKKKPYAGVDNFFRYQINGDIWNIYLVEEDDNVISEEDSAAETEFDNREMFFRNNDIDPRNIRHELWHAHFGSCYLGDTNDVSTDDVEEISACMFADKAEKMLIQAKEIEQILLSLKEKKNETKD